MRQQYHFRQSDKGLLAWDVFRLIELTSKQPVIEVALTEISEVDEPFWYELGGAKPTCKNIVEHIKLIEKTNLSYPIILCHQGRVMDGMHRVCKALLLGRTHIKAVRLSTYIEPDYVGVEPNELPY